MGPMTYLKMGHFGKEFLGHDCGGMPVEYKLGTRCGYVFEE